MFKLTLLQKVRWELQDADMYAKHNKFQMEHLSQLWLVGFVVGYGLIQLSPIWSKMCIYKTGGGGGVFAVHIINLINLINLI